MLSREAPLPRKVAAWCYFSLVILGPGVVGYVVLETLSPTAADALLVATAVLLAVLAVRCACLRATIDDHGVRIVGPFATRTLPTDAVQAVALVSLFVNVDSLEFRTNPKRRAWLWRAYAFDIAESEEVLEALGWRDYELYYLRSGRVLDADDIWSVGKVAFRPA